MYEEISTPAPYPVKRARPIAWITWILVASTVAVFLLQLLCLYLFGDDFIGNALAFGPQAMADHHYWTLLTYAWAHAVVMFGSSDLFWLHIVANMIPIICLGPALEEMLGHGRYVGLYLGGAIAAALVWFLFDRGGDDAIIGASGAVFAMIAAAGTAAPHARVTVLLFYLVPLRMSLRVLALAICGTELAQLVFHVLPEVAHTAHLGGAAFGFLYIMTLHLFSRKYAHMD